MFKKTFGAMGNSLNTTNPFFEGFTDPFQTEQALLFAKLQLTRQTKNGNHHSLFSKKNVNLTIDLVSLGIYAPGPQVLTYRPRFCGGVRI